MVNAMGAAPALTIMLVDCSGSPESIVQVHHWVWVQYENENGDLDNNLALVVAILRYRDGTRISPYFGVAKRKRDPTPSHNVSFVRTSA